MKTLTLLMIFFFTIIAHDDQETEALDAAKTHLIAFISLDTKTLESTFSDSVQLMAGHEFLKAKYKLVENGARNKGAAVKRELLLKVITESSADRPKPPVEKVKPKVDTLTFSVLKTKEGEFITSAADPVGTPDGKLHFNIIKGDVLVKAAPPKGDFVLFQMRKETGSWKVIAEYLD